MYKSTVESGDGTGPEVMAAGKKSFNKPDEGYCCKLENTN